MRGAPVHVKPHGALYNQAVRNRELAAAIAEGVGRWSRDVCVGWTRWLADAGCFFEKQDSRLLRKPSPTGVTRQTETLRSRKFEDALIRNPEEAAWQALGIAERGLSHCERRQRSRS